MRSKPVAALLVDLGIAKTHSRPRLGQQSLLGKPVQDIEVSARLPRTLRFDRRCSSALPSVRHSGIGLMTPHAVHYGHGAQITQQRREMLMTAFAAHPQRFNGLAPKPPAVPTAVWINPPTQEIITQKSSLPTR
jgi:putative transposase